ESCWAGATAAACAWGVSPSPLPPPERASAKTETIAAATAAPNMNCRKPPIRAHLHVALPFRPGGGLDGSQVSMAACGAELVDLPRERSLTSRPPSGTHLPTSRWDIDNSKVTGGRHEYQALAGGARNRAVRGTLDCIDGLGHVADSDARNRRCGKPVLAQRSSRRCLHCLLSQQTRASQRVRRLREAARPATRQGEYEWHRVYGRHRRQHADLSAHQERTVEPGSLRSHRPGPHHADRRQLDLLRVGADAVGR